MSAKIAVDLHLFEYITAKETPITVTELASLSGGEELLISEVIYSLGIQPTNLGYSSSLEASCSGRFCDGSR